MIGKGCTLNCKHCVQRKVVNHEQVEIFIEVCDIGKFEDCLTNDYKFHEYYIDPRE